MQELVKMMYSLLAINTELSASAFKLLVIKILLPCRLS